MFSFVNDKDIKTPFVVIGDKPAPKAILHIFSLFFQQHDPNHQLLIHEKKYPSIARAFAVLLNDIDDDFDLKFSDPEVQKQLKKIGLKEQDRTRENLKAWINSSSDDVIAMNRAFQANNILFKNDCAVLLTTLVHRTVAANLHEAQNFESLLIATQEDTCIVYDNFDSSMGLDKELANLLGCGEDGKGQNLFGLIWMQVRSQLAGQTPFMVRYKAMYNDFQAKRLPFNGKGKSILTLPVVELFPTNLQSAPYIAYLVATAEAPVGAAKSEVALYSQRSSFLFGWIANQTHLEMIRAGIRSEIGYALTKQETLRDDFFRSAPVFEGDDDQEKVVRRNIIRGSLLETLGTLKKEVAGNHLCVFQTVHRGENGVQLQGNNELIYASDYVCTLAKLNAERRSDVQVVVSKVTIMRDHKFALLAPQDRYVVDVITALCPSLVNCSVDDLLNNQYRALKQRYAYESPSHDRVTRRPLKERHSIHVLIADLAVSNALIKKDTTIKDPEGRLATTHNNALLNAISYTEALQSVTVLVHSEKLETSFNMISQSTGNRHKDYPICAPEKVVFATLFNDAHVISFLGYPGRESVKIAEKPSIRVFRNENDDALFFCFERNDLANEYTARLEHEHGFDKKLIDTRNSLSLTLPFNRPKSSESLCNSHPFVIRLNITSKQLLAIAEMVEYNREFWRPFTQKLLALFAMQEQVLRLQNEKTLLETNATRVARQKCAIEVNNVLDSLFNLKTSVYAPTLLRRPEKEPGEGKNEGDLALRIAKHRTEFLYFYLNPDKNELSPNCEKPPAGYDNVCKELSRILLEMTKILNKKMEQEDAMEQSYEHVAEFRSF